MVMNGNKARVNIVSLKAVFWEILSHVFVDVCACSPTAEMQSERARQTCSQSLLCPWDWSVFQWSGFPEASAPPQSNDVTS